MKVTSNISQVAKKWTDKKLEEVEEAIRRTMQKTGTVGEARVKGIMEREAYDTGRLLRSVNSVIYKNPNVYRLVISSNLEYAWYVEHGRKPGSGHGKNFPNLDALVKWVGRMLRREGVNTRVNVTFDQLQQMARTGRKPPTKQQEAYRTHLSALYLIGRKIATKGIREKLIFKRIEEGLLAYFRNELRNELQSIQ